MHYLYTIMMGLLILPFISAQTSFADCPNLDGSYEFNGERITIRTGFEKDHTSYTITRGKKKTHFMVVHSDSVVPSDNLQQQQPYCEGNSVFIPTSKKGGYQYVLAGDSLQIYLDKELKISAKKDLGLDKWFMRSYPNRSECETDTGTASNPASSLQDLQSSWAKLQPALASKFLTPYASNQPVRATWNAFEPTLGFEIPALRTTGPHSLQLGTHSFTLPALHTSNGLLLNELNFESIPLLGLHTQIHNYGPEQDDPIRDEFPHEGVFQNEEDEIEGVEHGIQNHNDDPVREHLQALGQKFSHRIYSETELKTRKDSGLYYRIKSDEDGSFIYPCKKCEYWDVPGNGSTRINRHVKIHEGWKFWCPFCHKLLGTMTSARRHVRMTSARGEEPKGCALARKKLPTKEDIENYLKKYEHLDKDTPFHIPSHELERINNEHPRNF